MESANQSKWVLVLIGCGKLLKALLLVFFAMELHHLLDPNFAEKMASAFHHIRVDPGNRHIHDFIAKCTGISAKRLNEIRLGSYLYAALFATEGIGLVLRKRWAEYMTVITTSLLLPMEGFEIFVGTHKLAKIVVILINMAIVVYLVLQLKKTHCSAAPGIAAEIPEKAAN
jgi:uncharacterized membrane protein (DUF2068 family)